MSFHSVLVPVVSAKKLAVHLILLLLETNLVSLLTLLLLIYDRAFLAVLPRLAFLVILLPQPLRY